jgi:hypothetical protein
MHLYDPTIGKGKALVCLFQITIRTLLGRASGDQTRAGRPRSRARILLVVRSPCCCRWRRRCPRTPRGTPLPRTVVSSTCALLLSPGCGKSALGRMLLAQGFCARSRTRFVARPASSPSSVPSLARTSTWRQIRRAWASGRVQLISRGEKRFR